MSLQNDRTPAQKSRRGSRDTREKYSCFLWKQVLYIRPLAVMQRYMMNIFVYFDTLITWNIAFNNSCILSFTEFDFIKLD